MKKSKTILLFSGIISSSLALSINATANPVTLFYADVASQCADPSNANLTEEVGPNPPFPAGERISYVVAPATAGDCTFSVAGGDDYEVTATNQTGRCLADVFVVVDTGTDFGNWDGNIAGSHAKKIAASWASGAVITFRLMNVVPNVSPNFDSLGVNSPGGPSNFSIVANDAGVKTGDVGACCDATGSECSQITECQCKGLHGAYRGEGVPCGPAAESGSQCSNNTDDDSDLRVNDGCPVAGAAPEFGAQCLNDTDDDGDSLVNDGCPADAACIPTVSEWGLLVMAVLVLTAATVVIMRRRAGAGLAAVMLLLVLTVPAARADNVAPGSDMFVTPGLPSGPTPTHQHVTLPPDFFGPGSDPFEGDVYFVGAPLAGTNTNGADTIVARLVPAPLPSCPSSATIPIEIIALSLVSNDPITVTFNAGTSSSTYDVQACLARPPTVQAQGSMVVNHTCPEGGTFSSTLPVIPHLTFTRVAGTSGLPNVALDPAPLMTFAGNGFWSHSDPGGIFGIIASPGGTVDHDCDGGTAAVPFPPTSNFIMGIRWNPCDCDLGTPETAKKRLTSEEALLASHGILPVEERQVNDDRDLDGIHDIADNCPGTYNPLQEPTKCGACCLPANGCVLEVTDVACHAMTGGHFMGNGTTLCAHNPDGSCKLGACCTPSKCGNNIDDDSDGKVNDGCPQVGAAPEAGVQCDNNTDDDGDAQVNDGCPQVGPAGEGCTLDVTEEECIKQAGRYFGDGSASCPADCLSIPTVSEWGLLVMAVLVLTAATVVIMRRRASVRG